VTLSESRTARRLAHAERLRRGAADLAASGERLHHVSVERLATASGMSRATFYIYFDDKAELVRVWATTLADDLLGVLERFATSHAADAASHAAWQQLLADLHAVLVAHATTVAAVREIEPRDTQLRRLVATAEARVREHLRVLLLAWQATGDVDDRLRPEAASGWLSALILRTLERTAADGDERATERLLAVGAQALAAALSRSVVDDVRRPDDAGRRASGDQ